MKEFNEISIPGARDLLNTGALFVDIRDLDAYAQSHIPGALHLTQESVESFIQKQDKSKPVVVYCNHGNSSKNGASFLTENGFKTVYSLIGGFESWKLNEKTES